MEGKNYLLLTGASSGVGREIAVYLSADYNLILNGRDQTRLQETLNCCNKKNHHLIWQHDLSDTNTIEHSLTQFILDNECLIQGFIHSAGYMKLIPLKMVTVNLFQTTFNVNVFAPVIIAKILTKKKLNKDCLKNIVLISSNISKFGAKASSAYGASKSATDGLMRCLAIELAPNIRVNSVLPGGMRTAMTAQIYENQDVVDRMNATTPLGEGTVKDIPGVVHFLLSNESRWITGQQITVDGGRTINITG
ncbi:MAG: SDR family oxidoreductase [Bacteroidales bacterium]|jgi:NAD(P)-dependent dehydrogenase (short-subunit alcohol dehydrogenase family)|nr:SDR family oxidoreductase [Bacteroidales bacterium]